MSYSRERILSGSLLYPDSPDFQVTCKPCLEQGCEAITASSPSSNKVAKPSILWTLSSPLTFAPLSTLPPSTPSPWTSMRKILWPLLHCSFFSFRWSQGRMEGIQIGSYIGIGSKLLQLKKSLKFCTNYKASPQHFPKL